MMAPSQMDYQHSENETTNVGYTHKKFNNGCYKHKKFGKRSSGIKEETPTAPALFRPYALSDNTPRKRRQESEQRSYQQQQHQLPPTPPTTPPQQHQQQQPPQHYQLYTPTPTPIINHQAFAYMLQKQRTVLQMRHMLSINPDANTWPTELRNALYAMLQR